MNAIDNFDKVQAYIDADHTAKGPDKFYFVQVLMRKGTNISDSNSNRARTLKTFYIPSDKLLSEYKDEIVYYCEKTNTRAYINLNARSFKKTALQAINLLSSAIRNEHETSAYTVYNKAVMDVPIVGKKTWFLDFDEKDYTDRTEYEKVFARCKTLLELKEIKFDIIPSKSGAHI